jgi:hypothetical protein
MTAHGAHGIDERLDRLAIVVALQIAENLVAVGHLGRLAQRRIEEPLQVIVAGARHDRRDDIVQVQITETRRRGQLVQSACAGIAEQDAGSGGHRPLTCLLP